MSSNIGKFNHSYTQIIGYTLFHSYPAWENLCTIKHDRFNVFFFFLIISGQQWKILLANFINKFQFHLILTIIIKKQVFFKKSVDNIKSKIRLAYTGVDSGIY